MNVSDELRDDTRRRYRALVAAMFPPADAMRGVAELLDAPGLDAIEALQRTVDAKLDRLRDEYLRLGGDERDLYRDLPQPEDDPMP